MLHDLHLALRQALRHPGFAAVVALTLALGIGANTAVFTVVHALLLRPLPWPDSHRVVNLWESHAGKGHAQTPLAAAQFVDLRRDCQSFAALAAWNPASVNLVEEGSPPERYAGALVTEDFFGVVGTQPVQGPGFAPDHFQPGQDGVVMIAHGIWRQRFGGDPAVLGRELTINGRSRSVVGVLPPGFDSPARAQFWVPKVFRPQDLLDRDFKAQRVLGRLADGVTLEQARSEVATRFAQLRASHPDFLDGWSIVMRPALEDVVQSIRPALWLLMGAVATVLLMACINVANLLLSRGVARAAEMSLRAALGSGRVRLVRQLLLESLLLAIPGGALGLLLAYGLLGGLLALAPASMPRMDQVRLDGTALLFTAGACVLTGLLFGFLPAWQLSRADPMDALRGGLGGRSAPAHGRQRRRLVIVQIAAAVVVLVLTGLLLRSFARVVNQDLGFQPESLLTVRLELPPVRYGPAGKRDQFADDVLARLAATPGVRSAAATTLLPFQGWPEWILRLEEQAGVRVSEAPSTGYAAVSPGYFATLGMHLRQGRDLSAEDREDREPVCVVSHSFARRHFGDRDPLGRRLEVGFSDPPRWLTVVGVVGDARNADLETLPRDQVFVPLRQQPAFLASNPALNLVIRTEGNPVALGDALRKAVWAVDPSQPLHLLQPMTRILDQALASRRFTLLVLGVFAGIALFLATLGLYGVMSAAVASRTREFGIRAALGAGRLELGRLVFSFGASTLACGLSAGLLLASAAGRILNSMLYQTAPWDLPAFGFAAGALTLAALPACARPAWTAARLDPAETLRSP